MARHTGRAGKVFAQIGAGTKYQGIELADSGDHKTFAASATQRPWGDTPKPKIKPNGVLSGLEVIIDNAAANDTVDIKAGTAWLKGVKTTLIAGTLATIARPLVAGQVLITAITLTEAGAFAKVAGTEGAAGGARGAAGGPPFIPTTSIELGEVALFGLPAAVITADEIDTAGAERGFIPGFEPDHVNGAGIASIILEAKHTATTARKVYADFRVTQLAEVGGVREWSLDVGKDTAETMAMGDTYKKSVPTFRNWSGKLSCYFDNPFWFELCDRDGYAQIKLRSDENDPFEFVGIANVEWGIKAPSSDVVTEDVSFTGNGPVQLLPV